MELLDFIINRTTLQNTCFICFNESKNTVNIDDWIEIHDENSTATVTLRNITKYLFSSYEILLRNACGNCADLIIKVYALMKRAKFKIEAMGKFVDIINEEIRSKPVSVNPIFITMKKQKNDKLLSKNTEDSNVQSNGKHSYKFNCNLPIIKSESKENHELHKNMKHTSNKSLVCVICGKQFKKTSSLKSHVNSHEVIECPYCFKQLKNNSHFSIHIRNHVKSTKRKVNKQYKCNHCGHNSRNKTDLESHMYKYHLKIRPYNCDICQKRFYSQRNLNEHTLTHINNKTNTCDICGEHFSGKPALNNHLKLHSGNRPYKCEVCGHSFVTASRKNEHVKRKHGEKQFFCTICDKKYCLNKTLNRHMKIMHGIVTMNVVPEMSTTSVPVPSFSTSFDSSVVVSLPTNS